jgi:hypothetical protein
LSERVIGLADSNISPLNFFWRNETMNKISVLLITSVFASGAAFAAPQATPAQPATAAMPANMPGMTGMQTTPAKPATAAMPANMPGIAGMEASPAASTTAHDAKTHQHKASKTKHMGHHAAKKADAAASETK